MAFCISGEFTVAKVGNSFCNFVLFHYAINKVTVAAGRRFFNALIEIAVDEARLTVYF